MRLHALQHVSFEGLGLIENWARGKGISISRTQFFNDEALPSLEDFDALVVMGGPMGTYDEEKFFWLRAEKDFLRRSIAAGKKVLGICLGSQLIAEVIGGRVFPGNEPEVGWFPVESVRENEFFPARFIPLHWHGDTFELPSEAIVLASTSCYRNQAFRYGTNCLGIQFHLELTENDVRMLAANDTGSKERRRFVQTPDEILANKENFRRSGALLEEVLEKFFSEG